MHLHLLIVTDNRTLCNAKFFYFLQKQQINQSKNFTQSLKSGMRKAVILLITFVGKMSFT